MDTHLLEQTGLNATQSKAYLALISSGGLTPPQLADKVGITRTNSYEVLKQLIELELVQLSPKSKKSLYEAQNPVRLKQLMIARQKQINEKATQLTSALPSLLATYRLAYDQPGVLKLDGLAGLTTIYDDILATAKPISVFPSSQDTEDNASMALIEKNILAQHRAGITTRALYPAERRTTTNVAAAAETGISIRFRTGAPYPAQILLYGDNIVMSTFGKGTTVTVLTNAALAATMLLIFDELWHQAAG